MRSSNRSIKSLKGGFLGIPNLGVSDMFNGKKKEDVNMAMTASPTPSSTEVRPVESTTASPASDDDAKKKCMAAADAKMKEAVDAKAECNKKYPNKSMFSLFGGKKRRSKSGKSKSHKRRNKKRTVRKSSR